MNHLTKQKIILYLALIFTAGGVTGAAIAWNSAQHRTSHRQYRDRGDKPQTMQSVCDRRRSRLQSRLGLTPVQIGKIDPILERAAKEMDAIHQGAIDQIQQILQSSDEEIATHLTDEQKAKLKEMEQERRRDFKSRHFRDRPPK